MILNKFFAELSAVENRKRVRGLLASVCALWNGIIPQCFHTSAVHKFVRMTYSSAFFEAGYHDNDIDVVLPDEKPEMVDRCSQWSLTRDEVTIPSMVLKLAGNSKELRHIEGYCFCH